MTCLEVAKNDPQKEGKNGGKCWGNSWRYQGQKWRNEWNTCGNWLEHSPMNVGSGVQMNVGSGGVGVNPHPRDDVQVLG